MYNILRLLLPLLTACTYISTSTASPVLPFLDLPVLGAFNHSFFNQSSVSNTTLPLNFSLGREDRHVPDSQIDLQLHFGFPKHQLDWNQLGHLMSFVNWLVADLLFENGPHGNVPRRGAKGNQAFYYSKGFIDVIVNHTPTHTLTWGELSDIIRGLGFWLWEKKQPYRTQFYATSSIYHGRIASGWVKEAGRSVTQS